MGTAASIEARGLCKHYGRAVAIRDLSFRVEPGEVVGFLGPNGAGKSTTMRILTGLIPATSGEAFLGDISVARYPEKARASIGYMAENNPLPEELRVVEYLRLRAQLKGLRGRQLRERVDEVMEVCDLRRKAAPRLIGSLSKGFRQRVGIADAVLGRPPVTILDEPTIGLDPHQVLLIRELIASLRGQTTVILSSHILAEVEISCDRVIILNQGHLVASGTLRELHQEFMGSDVYRVVVTGRREALMPLLGDWPPEVIPPEPAHLPEEGMHHLDFRLQGELDFARLLVERLRGMPGLHLQELRRLRPQLEEVFLAATRRSWETHTPFRPGRPEPVLPVA